MLQSLVVAPIGSGCNGTRALGVILQPNNRYSDGEDAREVKGYGEEGVLITNFFRKTNFFYRFFLPNPFNYN